MITLRALATIPPETVLWDSGKGSVTGFGARRQKGEAIAYVLKYRVDGRQRWATIGRHGSPWTPDLARAEARRLLGEVVKGGDPVEAKREARKAATVAELCDDYFAGVSAGRVLTRRGMSKKPSTVAIDRGRIDRHIKPVLGGLKVAAVTRRDIERLRDAITNGETAATIKTGKHGLARVTGGAGNATRVLGLLGGIFQYARRRGLRADNPVHGIERRPDRRRERRVSDAEYAALGEALRTMPATTWPLAVAATKFLALSGWRRGEMLALRWSEVDLAARRVRIAADLILQ